MTIFQFDFVIGCFIYRTLMFAAVMSYSHRTTYQVPFISVFEQMKGNHKIATPFILHANRLCTKLQLLFIQQKNCERLFTKKVREKCPMLFVNSSESLSSIVAVC